VLYITSDEERQKYAVNIVNGHLIHAQQHAYTDPSTNLCSTGEEGWIFVLRDGIMYAHPKLTRAPPRFHHSSFFGGEGVDAAGLFIAENGRLTKVFPHSGHYRPSGLHVLRITAELTARSPQRRISGTCLRFLPKMVSACQR
jgi:hypothetical protein